jgi:hypothetical protein
MAFHYRLGILRFATEQFRSFHSSRHIGRCRASGPLAHAPLLHPLVFLFAHALSPSVAGTVRGRVTTWAVPRRSHAEFSPRATRITRMLSFHPFCPTRSEGVAFLSLLNCAFGLILNFNYPTKHLIPKQQAALFAFIFLPATLLFFPRIASPATETGSCCSGRH